MLPQSAALHVLFPLPSGEIIASGTVIWSDVSGRAGACFAKVASQQQFEDWLNSLLCDHETHWKMKQESTSIGEADATRQ
jgi:hypothetical protein